MLLISHRGNLVGPNPSFENTQKYIQEALDKGFSVEIDLRTLNGELHLGHDYAQHSIDSNFLVLNRGRLWVHCKDSTAFEKAMQLQLNCFFHDSDDYTMTSFGYVWCYPNKTPIGKMSVSVLPEKHIDINQIDKSLFAVCSDYVLTIKNA
jgi:hypothetical protein